MLVDWRALLGELRIEWRDRGANCRRGNVNVACPMCRDDPSFHLAIAEDREAFYCYRNPDEHSGRDYIYLLVKLGAHRNEALRLLNRYKAYSGQEPAEASPREIIPGNKLSRMWDRFRPATESGRIVAYLRGRGIEKPYQVIERFDLRYAEYGPWAQRVLLPFRTPDHRIEGWTGRAINPGAALRYLTQETGDGGQLYVPRYPHRADGELTFVLVEGPLDALKGAIIARDQPFLFAAMTGKALIASRLVRLQNLRPFIKDALVCVDTDVKISNRLNIISTLSTVMKPRYIGRAELPNGVGDPGELPDNEGSHAWLLRQRDNLSSRRPPGA